jgi:HAD superfamily hydrolase (TIGR01509 family)
MNRLELVIFDCDGVLVDSEAIAQEVLSDVLARLGVELSVTAVGERFFGKTVPQCIEIIEAMIGRRIPDDFIAAWRDELYAQFRNRPVQAVAGVRDCIEQLDVAVCVVSNGPLEKMRTTLGVTGLLPVFENRLFSPDLGLPGKPEPDLFLAAAGAAGAAPQCCAVIEDSRGGVVGAIAAGMRAYGFTGLPHADARSLAAAGATLFTQMQELPQLLARDYSRAMAR